MNELFGKESAQAIGKVADTAAKGIDAGREFGGFFSRHFGGTVEQWAGLWEDKLKYRRWENQVALMLKAEAKIKELGLQGKLRPLEMKIGVPLLEAASLEEDEYLRDLWANLLVSSVNPNGNNITHPAFIQVIQNLTNAEAKIMNWIAGHHYYAEAIAEETSSIHGNEGNSFIEQKIQIAVKAGIDNSEKEEVEAWFDNLLRLELLKEESSHESTYTEGGHNRYGDYPPSVDTKYYKTLSLSSFGQKFVNCCILGGV